MFTSNKDIAFTPIEEYAKRATDEKIERTSRALEANGIQTLVAENGAEAVDSSPRVRMARSSSCIKLSPVAQIVLTVSMLRN